MRDFLIEISVEKDGRIIALDTDDMDISIYQKIEGEKVRIFEITCYDGASGPVTIAKFVGKKNCEKINVGASPDGVISVHS